MKRAGDCFWLFLFLLFLAWTRTLMAHHEVLVEEHYHHWHPHDRVYVNQPWYHSEHIYFYDGQAYPYYYLGYPYYYFDPRYYYFL